MPFKSNAQRKAMNAKCGRGEIPQHVCDEFNAASKGMKLPARAGSKKKAHSYIHRIISHR